jgi:two-component system response regulator HydG
MQNVYRKIKEVAPTDISVLIIGESGTGKELVANAIHEMSPRKSGPFVAVNTGAIPRELIASELFGHLKGAFTGAISDKKGKFEEADDGTLFLDEISTMDHQVQISLLRVLETQVIERVGSNRSINVNVRTIAATNESPEDLIQKDKFREDLYYRLNVFTIELPPLRDRKTDITYLANYYRQMFNLELSKNVTGFDSDVMEALKKYPWPGNVRELRNIVLRSVLASENEKPIKLSSLPKNILKPDLGGTNITFKPGTSLSEVEKTMIIQTLKAVKGNKLKASNILGISRRSLYNKLEEYNIPIEEV